VSNLPILLPKWAGWQSHNKIVADYPVHLVQPGVNGTAHLKNVNNYLNSNIYSYLETSGDQSSNLYLNAVHFFNTRVNWTSVAA
jgi:hypothetical protein